MPGSSFKVITTGIALRERRHDARPRRSRSRPSTCRRRPTDPIQNYGGTSCGGTMVEVFYRSCNIPFAQMAVELGPERMVDGTKAWGIGEEIPIDLPGAGRPAASARSPTSPTNCRCWRSAASGRPTT